MRTEDRTSTREAERLQAGQPRKAAASSAQGATPEGRSCWVYSSPTVARQPAPPMASRRRSGSARALAAGQWVAAVGLVGLLGGCAPEEELPLPPVVWEGESVRVRMDDPTIEVCGGSFEALDRHAELVREALLLEGDGVIEYSIGDQDFVDERCRNSPHESPQACTNTGNGRVFTTEQFSQHEIVHAVRVLDPRIELLSSAYEEGLATLYGADLVGREVTAPNALETLNDSNVAGSAEYDRAGQVVALLIELNGVEAFRRFNQSAIATSEAEAFLDILGETIEDFAAYADASPACERSQWWQPLLECDGEPIAPDPETGSMVLSGNLACGEADARGPSLGNMWISRHFRLDEATSSLGYRFEMPDDATLEIVACDGGCPERFAYIGTRYQVGSFGNGLPNLEPGEYYLRMSRPVSDDEGGFEITLE
jgi:hypothetical protein